MDEESTHAGDRDKEGGDSPASVEYSIVWDQSDGPVASAAMDDVIQSQDETNQQIAQQSSSKQDQSSGGAGSQTEGVDNHGFNPSTSKQYPVARRVSVDLSVDDIIDVHRCELVPDAEEDMIPVIALDSDNTGENATSFRADSTIDSMEYESAGNMSDLEVEKEAESNGTQETDPGNAAMPGCSMSIDSAKEPSDKVTNEALDEDVASDLLTCNICLSEIDNPKSLPCLHTFCKDCLQKWDKVRPDDLICPTCQEKCLLPPDGIDGLKGNFFVTKLKDRKNLKRRLKCEKIPCSACSSGVEASSRCVDCDDFLCGACEEVHKTLRVLKAHRVIKLAELKSGKIKLSKMPKQMEQCKKHSGQILWFYCETCCMLICRDCTVVDHCRPEHAYINLEDAIDGQRQKIISVTADCKKILTEVEDSLSTLKKHRNQVGVAAKQAAVSVDLAADRAITDLQACVEVKRKDHHAHIELVQDQRVNCIDKQKANFQLLSTRLRTALDMSQQVTEDGTEFEVASTFPSLMTTLEQLKKTNVPAVRNELSKLSFEINEGPLFTIHELGQVRKYDKWERKCRFGRGTESPKGISKAWAVAVTGDGKVAVANNSSNGVVSVHSAQMPHQMCAMLDTTKGLEGNPRDWKSFPRGVAVAANGHFYVADNTMFVKEYNEDGKYLAQFSAISMCGRPSNELKITLDMVAVDDQDNLLIGPNQYKFISIHNSSGAHFRSIAVPVEPHFIAAASGGKLIIISSHIANTTHVIDADGNSLHELKAEGIPAWRPRGVCCTKDGEVFISNALKEKGGEASGIYRFNLAGKFLGCVTKDVHVPYGLALSDDDKTLVVGDKRSVSIFEWK